MDLSQFKKPPKNINFADLVVHEDSDLVFINKPPFISSLPERTADKALSIQQMAKESYDDIQLCHRLDKETSGIMVLAKNSAAYRHVAMQFENREIKKEYHAVVNGVHHLDSISVFLPIAVLKDGTAVRIDRMKGKLAETIFFTERNYERHTLVRCYPITGRMHQIRVHLQCLEAPIVSDPTYGGDYIYLSSLKRKFNLKMDTDELPLIKRVALHAYRISLTHINGELLEVTAPYPKDFDVLVKQLDKYSLV